MSENSPKRKSPMLAAVYCRVSTDSKEQINSFNSQKRYFSDYIAAAHDMELYKIYADEGLSGTETEKRTAFNQMMKDADERKFNIILTKEVSRFSRNILDTVYFTRKLKASGIIVIFINDGINTGDPDAELRLSIMASLAQEESRRTSSRVKWGQTRRMEQGVVFGRSLLGYDVKNGKITVNNHGAAIVRLIFNKYIYEKKGCAKIASELKSDGYLTYSGNDNWRGSVIIKILKNEKYCGDLIQKKTYTPDYLSHKKKYNHGEEEMIYIKNHHTAIISRKLFNETQDEIKKRRRGSSDTGYGNRYPLSGKIRCSECGKYFLARLRKCNDGSKYLTWRCSSCVAHGKSACSIGFQIRDDKCIEIIQKILSNLQINKDAVISELAETVKAAKEEINNKRISYSQKAIKEITLKKKRILDKFAALDISYSDFKLMNDEYTLQLEILENSYKEEIKITEIADSIFDICGKKQADSEFLGNLVEEILVFSDKKAEIRIVGLPAFPVSV